MRDRNRHPLSKLWRIAVALVATLALTLGMAQAARALDTAGMTVTLAGGDLAVHPATIDVIAGSTYHGDLNDYVTGGEGTRVFGPVETNVPTAGGGTLTIAADGSFTYTAPATAGTDDFDFTVIDDSVPQPLPGTVDVNIHEPLQVNSPTLDVAPGATITGDLNDYVTGGFGDRIFGPVETAITTPGGGTLTIHPDGTFTYTAPDHEGDDHFPFNVKDDSVTEPVDGTVNLRIRGGGERLQIVPCGVSVEPGETITGDLNDCVTGGDGNRDFGPGGPQTTPGGGSVTINPDGSYTYTAPDTSGEDQIPFTVEDGTVDEPLDGQVDVDVESPLEIVPCPIEVEPGETVIGDLNDCVTGGDGNRTFGPDGTHTTPGGGTVTIEPNGKYTYTAPRTTGTDVIDFTVIDGTITTPLTGTVDITISIKPAGPTPTHEPVTELPETGGGSGNQNGGFGGFLPLLALLVLAGLAAIGFALRPNNNHGGR